MPMIEIPVMATQSVSTIISVVREKTISWTESSMQDDWSSSVCPENDCDAILVAVDVAMAVDVWEAAVPRKVTDSVSTRVSRRQGDRRST